MKTFFSKNHRVIFYGCWVLLAIIQSSFTELLDDEAYYWVYSRFLDWGYFDHPPMIGLLIKAGYAIFPNELGVRLFPIIMNTLSIGIIEKLICIRKTAGSNTPVYLFYAIILSIAVLQVSGFVAVPDTPLIFFTALFFLLYKRFIANYSLLNTFLLGLGTALLFYSKYHAVLVVLFTFLSNKKLFSRYQTYLAGLIALAFFFPHLWWQYQHNWISFRYQLFESNVNPYRITFTTDYLLGQILIAGPIAGFILVPAAFLYKTKSEVEKTLRFTLFGIYIFFLLSSFRGRVEANWTAPALIPLVILSYRYLLEKGKWKKYLFRLLPVTLLLIFIARLLMIFDIAPIKFIKSSYHHWKEWPSEMKKRTKDLPVVFGSSYQRASKYWFYSGQPAYSLNNYKQRKNNYNLWPIEDSLLGKPVYFMNTQNLGRFKDSLQTPIGWLGYKYDSSFVSYAKIQVETVANKIIAAPGKEIRLHCTFKMPAYYAHFIKEHNYLKDTVRIGLFGEKGWIRDIFTGINLNQVISENKRTFSFYPDLPKGEYYLRFAINNGYHDPTHNSNKIKLIIK